MLISAGLLLANKIKEFYVHSIVDILNSASRILQC